MGHFRPYNERLNNFCGITPVFNKTGIKIFGIADFVACRTFDTIPMKLNGVACQRFDL